MPDTTGWSVGHLRPCLHHAPPPAAVPPESHLTITFPSQASPTSSGSMRVDPQRVITLLHQAELAWKLGETNGMTMTPESQIKRRVADRRVLHLGKGNRLITPRQGQPSLRLACRRSATVPCVRRALSPQPPCIHARPLDILFTSAPRLSDFGLHQIQDAGDFMGRDSRTISTASFLWEAALFAISLNSSAASAIAH